MRLSKWDTASLSPQGNWQESLRHQRTRRAMPHLSAALFSQNMELTSFLACSDSIKNWSGWQVLPLLPPSSKLGRLLLTYTLNLDVRTGIAPASKCFAGTRLAIRPPNGSGEIGETRTL